MELLGSFNVKATEQLFPGRAVQPGALAMIGNVGSSLWPFFDAARRENPDLTLDHWTEGVISKIASDFGVEAVYPFEGPPFHPFIQWAKRTGSIFSSPIGLSIHPDYGLWLAFRAALLIDHPLAISPADATHPCESCEGRPCLSTCPAGAFTEPGYDFDTCLNHVASPVNACRDEGCLARLACPIGENHRYRKPHAAFHMSQLLKAHGKL